MTDTSSSDDVTGNGSSSEEAGSSTDSSGAAGEQNKEETLEFWKTSHKEATTKIGELAEKNKSLEADISTLKTHLGLDRPVKTEVEEKDKPDPRYVTKDELTQRDFEGSMQKHPKLEEHKQEIQGYMQKGLTFEQSANLVYVDHGMTRDEDVLKLLRRESTPGLHATPSGRQVSGETRTPDQIEQDEREGIKAEDHKKFGAQADEIWRRAGVGV